MNNPPLSLFPRNPERGSAPKTAASCGSALPDGSPERKVDTVMQSTTNSVHARPTTQCLLVLRHLAEPPCGPNLLWEPQIVFRAPPGTRHRELLAMLHRLAADVERATQDSERWTVVIDLGGGSLGADGRVVLELPRTDDVTGAEAIRGLLTLRKAVGEP